MFRSALTASLLVIAACAVGGAPDTTAPDPGSSPGRLVAWDSDSIAVLDDPGSALVSRRLETGGLAVSQVTPSQDGRVVWTGAAAEGAIPGTAMVTSLSTGMSSEVEVPTVPFFYHWSPRGDRIVFLGNDPGGTGVLFGSLDPATGDALRHGVATPFFLDWSPDGGRVAANIGAVRLGIVDVPEATVEDIGIDPGRFATPSWTANGLFVVRRSRAAIAAPLRQIAFQTETDEVVRVDASTGDRSTLATAAVPVRLFAGADGQRLAIVGGAIGSQRLIAMDVDSGTVIAERASSSFDLVQWSPDGAGLLYTTRDDSTGRLTPWVFRPGNDADLEFESFRPSAELASVYLPFWDQYERALSLWSGDSAMFVVPVAGDRLRLILLDGDPIEVEGFTMAAFTTISNP